jgi:hypothetical protein
MISITVVEAVVRKFGDETVLGVPVHPQADLAPAVSNQLRSRPREGGRRLT